MATEDFQWQAIRSTWCERLEILRLASEGERLVLRFLEQTKLGLPG